jgi:hypothetical protein
MILGELHQDLTPGRVTDPVRLADAQVIGEPGEMTGVVGNRQMAGWLASRIPSAANAYHAERVERTTLAERQKPIGKDASVHKDNSLAGATVRVRNLARLDW